MSQPSDPFKLRKAYFHALGKANTEATQEVYESQYKSLGNVTAKDVWLQNVGFASDELSADGFVSTSPSIVKKYTMASLKPVPGSNYQTYYFEYNGQWIRPWISPVDVPHPSTNAPSNGYGAKLYKSDGSIIAPTIGVWMIDYYAGAVYFQENYTPVDLGWGSSSVHPKITFYSYVGKTLSDKESEEWEIEREVITLDSDILSQKRIQLAYAMNNQKDVMFHVDGGTYQMAGIDYSISGVNNLVWTPDSEMGTNLEIGDIVEVKYSKLV